jgi:hypothetical protein
MANRVGGSIVLPAPTPPDLRVRVRRLQVPAAFLLTAPGACQLRRSGPGFPWRMTLSARAARNPRRLAFAGRFTCAK